MKRLLIILLLLLSAYLLLCRDNDSRLEDIIDLALLNSGGDAWKVVSRDIAPERGNVQLYSDRWLMFFLHWRPLNRETPPLSVACVRRLMLNFWGEAMPFTIQGEGGEVSVAGHRACFIDGTIWDGKIRTRFIVWDCEESGRRFIADCNINQGRGTALKWLELQYEMVGSISCHGQRPGAPHNDLLNHRFSSVSMDISFAKPKQWNTSLFQSREWYPHGPTPRKGSFWTLTTTSSRLVRVDWVSPPLTGAAQWRQYLQGFSGSDFNVYEKYPGVLKIIDIGEVTTRGERFRADVGLSLIIDYRGKPVTRNFRGIAESWIFEGKRITVLAAMVALESMWERPFDLVPTPETRRLFLEREVMPSVRWQPGVPPGG